MPKLKSRNFVGIILVIILSLGVSLNLFKSGYFSMHDDLQVMRLFEIEKCFLDGQIPCRWVPDMGAGFGYPLFNFYSPFPYYLGMTFRIVGISFAGIVKVLFGLSLILSGIFMYLLVKEFFGKTAGVVAAVLYLYAPYHAVDVYVRGALAESWALVFFPLIFWAVYKFIKTKKKEWFVFSVLSLSGLFLSHNVMTILFIPAVVAWLVFWLASEKKIRILFPLISIFVLAFGLGAFFLLPSFFEKSLVNIEWLTSDYFDFRNHFVSLYQLFISRFWGYGPSRLGSEDGMSFQLGWVQWVVAALGGVLTFWSFFIPKNKKVKVMILIFFLWISSVFMTHARSIFVWETVPLMSFVQFPWRFLGISMFMSSFLAGGLMAQVKSKLQIFLAGIIVLMVIILNIGYFQPEFFYPKINDQEILSGDSWKKQSMGAILDYLPRTVKELPKDSAPDSPRVVEGNAMITQYAKRSNFWRFTFESLSNSPAKVKVPVFDFPVWTVLIDQNKASFSSDNSEGVIEITVPPGKHTIVGWFEDTPIRTLGNVLTIISFLTLVIFLVVGNFANEKTV